MQTIREILGLDFLSLSFDDEDRKKYNANASGKRIEEVIIDGVKITGYSAFSFVRKLTYVKSPTRSADGTIGNLNSYPTFTTPQLQIDFSLLGIDMYRKIMNLIYARREHLVQCYDIVRDKQVTEKMYFEPEELPKLATITRQLQGEPNARIEILGVQDYVVTMVGTNIPNEMININYYDYNNKLIGSEQLVENTEISLGEGISVDVVDGNKFDNKWQRGYVDENGDWVDIEKESYIGKQAYSVVLESVKEIANKSISFKAVYKSNREFNLILNYGLGEVKTDYFGNQLTTFPFTVGESISTIIQNKEDSNLTGLPTTFAPLYEYEGVNYATYTRKGWYYYPTYKEGLVKIKDTDTISTESDVVIYQLFEPINWTITFKSNYDNIAPTVETMSSIAGNKVSIPKFKSFEFGGNKFNFNGWYLDKDYTKQFDGIMPPKNITLYAKWSLEND